MEQEQMGFRLKVEWKLEKFDGEMQEGSSPVEVLEGEDILPEEVVNALN